MYQKIFIGHKRVAVAATALLLAFGAGSAHADALKCRRTIAKNAAGFEAKKIKALQKCQDGLLKGNPGPCPDAKASDKITKALGKLTDKITGDCAGLTLTEMNFAGLASECNLGYTPGLPCQDPLDCKGTCHTGRYEGEPCDVDGFCQGFCGDSAPGTVCTTDTDCNLSLPQQCVGGTCVTARQPFQTCQADATCTTAPFTHCYEPNGGCDNEHECQPVDKCPSVQNDRKTDPFGIDVSLAGDCYFPLTGEADVAQCVSCVGEQVVDQLVGDYYASAAAASSDSGVLKCQRSLGKNAAKYYATVRKALQKCEDGVLKAGSGTCSPPDAKTQSKIDKAKQKLLDKISADCGDSATLVQAFVLSQLVGRSGRPSGACSALVSDAASVANAIECLTAAAASCNDSLGIGSSPLGCNPNCGNSKIDAGETCDDGNQLQESGTGPADVCPSDCNIAACTPMGTQGATVNFASATPLTGLTVVLYYDESKVSIPGQNSDPPVVAALNSSTFSMTPLDTNYALRNVLIDPSLLGVAAGEAFTVTFDGCQGAPAPVAADFHCYVADATDASLAPVVGVTCSVTVP
jgi:hypothetical protein